MVTVQSVAIIILWLDFHSGILRLNYCNFFTPFISAAEAGATLLNLSRDKFYFGTLALLQ
jgi:hypothetical protein